MLAGLTLSKQGPCAGFKRSAGQMLDEDFGMFGVSCALAPTSCAHVVSDTTLLAGRTCPPTTSWATWEDPCHQARQAGRLRGHHQEGHPAEGSTCAQVQKPSVAPSMTCPYTTTVRRRCRSNEQMHACRLWDDERYWPHGDALRANGAHDELWHGRLPRRAHDGQHAHGRLQRHGHGWLQQHALR